MLSFLAPTCQVVEETASPPTPLQGERGVDCLAALVVNNAILGYYFFLQFRILFFACNVETRHLTPLSPWRGVGGEAGMGWG